MEYTPLKSDIQAVSLQFGAVVIAKRSRVDDRWLLQIIDGHEVAYGVNSVQTSRTVCTIFEGGLLCDSLEQ